MKQILSLVTVVLGIGVSPLCCGQGTLVFANNPSSLVEFAPRWPEPGHPATVADQIFVRLLWAPLGTTDLSLFQVVGPHVQVGIPVAGRFTGGVRTVLVQRETPVGLKS
jgi:hypothetical protein